MKNVFKFLGIITLVSVIVFSMAACNKNRNYDYSKILKGDFSDFAGIWKNGSYTSFRFKTDGTYGDFERTSDVSKESGGYYTWSLSDDRGMALFPVGVDIIVDGKIIQTDKTKVRIRSGNYGSTNADIYYLEASDAEIAEAEAFQAALSEGYSGLLKGDFSAVAGTYLDAKSNYSTQLLSNGTFGGDEVASAVHRNTNGTYSWGIGYAGGDGGGYAVCLFPVGVDLWGIPTDETKVRMTRGQDFDPSSSPIYYYYPEQTAFYYATSNLRLRSEPDTSKNNRIAGIHEGDSVALLEVGKTDNIDGINAPWYRVKTADGTIGWVFSGYLMALLEFYYNLGTDRLHWYQTSKKEWTEKAPDGNKNYFTFEKELVLDGVRGTVVKRSSAYTDTGFRLFIPNKGEKNGMIRGYDPKFYGTSEWINIGDITYLN